MRIILHFWQLYQMLNTAARGVLGWEFMSSTSTYRSFRPLKARSRLGSQRGQGEILGGRTTRGEHNCFRLSPAHVVQGPGERRGRGHSSEGKGKKMGRVMGAQVPSSSSPASPCAVSATAARRSQGASGVASQAPIPWDGGGAWQSTGSAPCS